MSSSVRSTPLRLLTQDCTESVLAVHNCGTHKLHSVGEDSHNVETFVCLFFLLVLRTLFRDGKPKRRNLLSY